MTDAKKCDRCGAFYEENKNHKSYTRNIVGVHLRYQDTNIARYDLCDECVKELLYFLSREELKNK